MKKQFRLFLSLNIVLALATSALAGTAKLPAFDRGPDPKDEMQRDLLRIIQKLPFLPGISQKVEVLAPEYKEGQKFRPDFGAMPIRGFLQPNSISVLVIGQDGTHIAEGANRPGIAGFGGRVHDMLMHFGVLQGVAFTNLYVNTISGQYGSRATPVVKTGKDGVAQIVYQNVIENRQWLMTHEGPYGQWRNEFLSWIIFNNMESLKLVMLLGQAGKDAGANFVNYLGAKVTANEAIGTGEQFNVPVFEMVGAGGNNEWAVPLTKDGEDIAKILLKDPAIKAATKAILVKELADLEAEVADDLAKYNNELAIAKSKKASVKAVQKKIDRLMGPVNVAKKRVAVVDKTLVYKDGDMDTGLGISSYVAATVLEENSDKAISLMTFSNGGPKQNGVMYPQQFGGWDLKTMSVNGNYTRSIQGLSIPCGAIKAGPCRNQSSVPAPDIVFVGAPHPTALSGLMNPAKAADKVERELLNPLYVERARGWIPPQPEINPKAKLLSPDKNLPSLFLAEKRQPYTYGRGVIPPSHGDPGITDMRLLPVSTAKREGNSVIVIGTRGKATFDQKKLRAMEKDTPSTAQLAGSKNVLTGRPKFDEWLDKYDRGPNEKYSKLLFKTLKTQKQRILSPKAAHQAAYRKAYKEALVEVREDKQETAHDVAQQKAKDAKDKNWEKARAPKVQLDDDDREEAYLLAISEIYNEFGIDGFNFKSHPEAGFFGHYRGSFENAKAIILADPAGYDAFITSKALTGDRGQYVNGLMSDIGVDKDYLVLSTVPMMMDGATAPEWKDVLKSTEKWRTDLIKAVIADNKGALLLADGPNAASELKRLKLKFIEIPRTQDSKNDMFEAGKKIANVAPFSSGRILGQGRRLDIPREHLTWIARTWEGTSGDRVITADDKANKGKAYAIVAPNWATEADTFFTEAEQESIKEMITRLANAGEPFPGESVEDFAKRRANCVSLAESAATTTNKPVCQPSAEALSFPGTLRSAGSF